MKTLAALAAAFICFPLFFVVLFAGGDAECGMNPGGDDTPATKTVDPDDIPADAVGPWVKDPQLMNAAFIMNAAKDLDLPLRAQMIGVMTAMGESGLRVLDRGDAVGPDSRGLFQQRGNGAWGSYEDRMDPYISSTSFFKALKGVDGWQSLDPSEAAHRVQGNADPDHYTQYWDDATDVVSTLGDVTISDANDDSDAGGPAETGRDYDLPDVQPHVQQAADTLGNKYGIKTIGGYRPSDTYDTEGHPAGLALDFMTNDIDNGSTVGWELAHYAQDHADELAVSYIIFEQKIWNPNRADEGWRAMEDRGSPTQNHMDHVHISFNADPGSGITGDDNGGDDSSVEPCPADDGGDSKTPKGDGGKAGPWGGYENGRIPLDELKEIPWAPNMYVRTDAGDALMRMNNAYRRDFGVDMSITSAYRSYEDQVRVKKEKGNLAATPGHSNHGWALAIDYGGGINQFGTTEHKWMVEHAGEYGWVHPDWAHQDGSKPEAWHWEYWG